MMEEITATTRLPTKKGSNMSQLKSNKASQLKLETRSLSDFSMYLNLSLFPRTMEPKYVMTGYMNGTVYGLVINVQAIARIFLTLKITAKSRVTGICKPMGMANPTKTPIATARDVFSGLSGCLRNFTNVFLIVFLLKKFGIMVK